MDRYIIEIETQGSIPQVRVVFGFRVIAQSVQVKGAKKKVEKSFFLVSGQFLKVLVDGSL